MYVRNWGSLWRAQPLNVPSVRICCSTNECSLLISSYKDGSDKIRSGTSWCDNLVTSKCACDSKCRETSWRSDNHTFLSFIHISYNHWWKKDLWVSTDYTCALSLTTVDINRVPFKMLSSEWTNTTCPRKTGTQSLSWVSAIVRMTLCSRRLRPQPRRHLRGSEHIVSQNVMMRCSCI